MELPKCHPVSLFTLYHLHGRLSLSLLFSLSLNTLLFLLLDAAPSLWRHPLLLTGPVISTHFFLLRFMFSSLNFWCESPNYLLLSPTLAPIVLPIEWTFHLSKSWTQSGLSHGLTKQRTRLPSLLYGCTGTETKVFTSEFAAGTPNSGMAVLPWDRRRE